MTFWNIFGVVMFVFLAIVGVAMIAMAVAEFIGWWKDGRP